MQEPWTEEQNEELIREAIAKADAVASTDAEFVQILRAAYFSEHRGLRKEFQAMRTGGRAADAAGMRNAPADPSFQIWDDPRFLQNARVLASRVADRLRIIGGTEVAGQEFADCVAVGNDRNWGCSGTLIAPNVVVSAGHCVKYATRVFFGNDVTGNGRVIRVARAVQHQGYHRTHNNDLMVLVLEENSTVTPRRIAYSGAIDAATDGRAVGFGNIDPSGTFGYGTKRQVDVPIASIACTGKVGNQTDRMAYGCDRRLEFVAGKPLLAKDSCTGDSGGPFYVQTADGWVVAGATSRATKSAMSNCGDGGIYARLDRYREWIEDTASVKLL